MAIPAPDRVRDMMTRTPAAWADRIARRMYLTPWLEDGVSVVDVFGRIPNEDESGITAIIVAAGWSEVEFVAMGSSTRVRLTE